MSSLVPAGSNGGDLSSSASKKENSALNENNNTILQNHHNTSNSSEDNSEGRKDIGSAKTASNQSNFEIKGCSRNLGFLPAARSATQV